VRKQKPYSSVCFPTSLLSNPYRMLTSRPSCAVIIRRSHFLACDAEDALWLLHTDGCPHNGYSGCGGGGYGTPGSSDEGSDAENDSDSGCSCCSHHSHSTCDHSHSHPHNPHHSHHHRSDNEKAPHNPLRPPGSPTLAPEAEEPDPLNALETLRRTELLELLSLTGSHASFIREGRKSVERVRIVECLFRRLISRDEELLVKAYRGGHDHVRFGDPPQFSVICILICASLCRSFVSSKIQPSSPFPPSPDSITHFNEPRQQN